ncbi:MAG: SBBP repeat-containing protein [Bacteroidota bacterium]|nr:SBBP repeat-containing protein [Bacteroidota bacterium]
MKNQMTFLILFIVLDFCNLQAQVTQELVARYNGTGNGNDFAYSLAVDGLGNVYVTGKSTGSGTGYDYATIKYNSSGAQQWIQIYNGPGNGSDYAHSLAVDGSGNVYVTGTCEGNGTGRDYATIKYNSSGDSLWVSIYNGDPGIGQDNAPSLAVDGSGNVYVTGVSNASQSGLMDYATIKYNSSGIQQWVQRYNGPGNLEDYASSLAVDGSGNVYVTGASATTGPIGDYATIKYNSSGVPQWVQRYGPADINSIPPSLAVDSSGNVYVTGESVGSGSVGDYATIKYNSSGDSLWVARYNGPGNSSDGASSIAIDDSGNVYVTGYSCRYFGGVDAEYATIKYNSSGVQQWIQRYTTSENDHEYPHSLAVDGSGNVYVTGFSRRGTIYDYATIKYNSSGVQQWVQRYNGPGNWYNAACALAVDSSGNVYVTGWSYGSGTGYDYATIKYSQAEGIAAPSNLEAQSVDSSYIKINWQDNSNDEDGFYIERAKINDSSHWEVIDAVPQNVNEYSDYFVTRALKYFYRVKAYSENTFSEYSNIDSATLGGNPLFIPAPPSNLVILQRTANTIEMNWHDNSGNENGFIIFRKTEGDLFFEIIDSVHTDVVTYQEVGVNPNHNYSYKICSFNQSGISDYSNTLIVLAKSAPVKTSEFSGNNILYGNYPNPFNTVTNLDFGISKLGFVSLKIYNVLGKEVATLVNAKLNPGTYKYNFDASFLSSGVYFYKLQTGEFIETRRMTLIK